MTTIRIEQDSNPESPREWSNMGTMIAFHGKYNLGDSGHGFNSDDYDGWDELEAAIRRKYGRGCIILPLYLYDHSGITMNTTGFSCRWDSGRVGFIVASLAKVRECFMVKRVTDKVRERAIESLRSEVAVYDQYLTGDVYGFIMEGDNGEEESCWGFYGSDPFKNGMDGHIPKQFHEILRQAAP